VKDLTPPRSAFGAPPQGGDPTGPAKPVDLTPPRSAFGAPHQGGDPAGPAKPVPGRLLDAPALAQKRGLLLGTQGWLAVLASLAVITVLFPVLNLLVSDTSALHISDYAVGLTGKILCYAICALAMDLIWGYTGILSLGHGLFFALGGYGMGMYLMRQIGRDGNYKSELPDFMVFLNWKELPWTWAWSDSFAAQMLLVVAVPGLLAFAFGYFAFRSRIKGVYFSIITQALTFAAMLLFFRNETGFGGNNGFTDFKRILSLPIATQGTRIVLFVITGCTLVAFYLLARAIVNSKFGRVLQAIRDAETRVMFTGYNPLAYKLSIWTLSAVMCAIAGALYVPQVGIINPSEMSPAAGIEIAIWAAVGGRATLIGPIVGAFFVNGAKSWFTVAFPEFWLYFLGALFIAVTLFLPQGIVGLFRRPGGIFGLFRQTTEKKS
jgi:urea transport system permease protein